MTGLSYDHFQDALESRHSALTKDRTIDLHTSRLTINGQQHRLIDNLQAHLHSTITVVDDQLMEPTRSEDLIVRPMVFHNTMYVTDHVRVDFHHEQFLAPQVQVFMLADGIDLTCRHQR
ncbi:hypothetical protein D3C78_1219200 [compost metagenome]